MNISIDLTNIEEFVLSEKFRDFLLSNTTEFGTAAFVLQTLLDEIEEIRLKEKEQEFKNRNADKSGEWLINFDGYYLYCPFCGHTPKDKEVVCPDCGATLE